MDDLNELQQLMEKTPQAIEALLDEKKTLANLELDMYRAMIAWNRGLERWEEAKADYGDYLLPAQKEALGFNETLGRRKPAPRTTFQVEWPGEDGDADYVSDED